MKIRRVTASILAILKVLAISTSAANAVSLSNYSPNPQMIRTETVNSNWTQAKSNPDYAFSKIINSTTGSINLRLKNLKTGQIQTLLRSSAISELSSVMDVAPNGRTIIYEIETQDGDEYFKQTYILNTNGQKFFLLSDGIKRKAEHKVELSKISFVGNSVDLFYSRKDMKELEKKTIDLEAKYSLTMNTVTDLDKIAKFYGGSMPYGVSETKETEEKNKNIIDIFFNPAISSIKKHKLVIENGRITQFYEYTNNIEIASTKAEFIKASYLTENFIYNAKEELMYSGASFGDPSIDLISLNKYLRKEVEAFYNGDISAKAKISILGKKFFIDLNDGSDLPVHNLQFTFSYGNFGDYGFYSFSRQSRDLKNKEIFVYFDKNQSVTYSKAAGNFKEKTILNDVDDFNFDYISLSSDILKSGIAENLSDTINSR